ncbi:MAG TPA: glycosyltransferase [Candidatus Limnocylindrales bacterium]|nr:glycosyltransferase [Candidatus Limnocylindrales bacterium]
MKVLHVTGVYPSPENPHTGSFIGFQVDSLRKKGIQADVCVLKGRGLKKYLGGIYQVREKLRSKEYDIVHAHYMYAGWTARLATTLPLVVSYMGNDVLGNCDDSGRYTLRTILSHRFLSNLLSILSSYSIAKSHELANCLITKKKSVIPNGIDLEIFRPKEVDRLELNLPEEKFYILFAGRKSDPVKRYPLAKAAVDLLRQSISSVELITVEGKPPSMVADYLNAVNCLLLTSAHEGSPNIVKEALACNLPIVAVDVGDIRERLEGVENCYLVKHDPVHISSALQKVLQTNTRLRNGRNKVLALSLEAVADKIIEIYKIILKRTG